MTNDYCSFGNTSYRLGPARNAEWDFDCAISRHILGLFPRFPARELFSQRKDANRDIFRNLDSREYIKKQGPFQIKGATLKIKRRWRRFSSGHALEATRWIDKNRTDHPDNSPSCLFYCTMGSWRLNLFPHVFDLEELSGPYVFNKWHAVSKMPNHQLRTHITET
jgi:hypothetical protein